MALRLVQTHWLLAVAAITTAATRTAITRTTATARTSTTMPAAATATAISAWGTITSWTIRSSRCYSFTICIFAIEVRFAAFIGAKVTTAFEGNSFFAFAAWLGRRTFTMLAAFTARTLTRRSAFTISALRRHFCALLAQNRFAAQLNAVAFNPQDFDQDLVAFLEFVFHFFHPMFSNLADVQQPIGSRNDFDERAKLSQPHHFAQIRLADFRHCREVVNALNRPLRTRPVV